MPRELPPIEAFSEVNLSVCRELFAEVCRNTEGCGEGGLAFHVSPDVGYGGTDDDAEFCNTNHPDTAYELIVFERPVEIFGGRHDGAKVCDGLIIRLEPIIALLTPDPDKGRIEVTACSGHPGEPAHTSIGGIYRGRYFMLDIFAAPPNTTWEYRAYGVSGEQDDAD